MKYEYTEKSREISGFGGGYEATCRAMVIAGMKWFDENPSANPKFKVYENVYGIINEENPEAKSLTDVMTDVMAEAGEDDITGAMMLASVGHCIYAAYNGWDKYIEEMERLKEEEA